MAVSSRSWDEEVDRWSKVGEMGMEAALREIGCPEQRIEKALEKNNRLEFNSANFKRRSNVREGPTRRMSEGVELCEEGDVDSDDDSAVDSAVDSDADSNVDSNVDSDVDSIVDSNVDPNVDSDVDSDCYTELERSTILATVGRGSSRIESLFLGYDVTENEVTAVCVNLTSNTKITSLTVRGRDSPFSRCAGCTLLGSAIGTNPSIETLNFSYMGVGREGVSCLMKGLQRSKSMQKLDLSGNPMGDDGVRVVAEFLGNAFKSNSTLRILLLYDVGMGSEGLRCLLKWLLLSETLEVLGLSWNPLGDEAVSLVAQFLATNTNIKDLDVRNVGCRLEGARHLSSALARNTSLKKFRFGPFYESAGVDPRYEEARIREYHYLQENTSLGADLVECFRVILGAISPGVEDSPLSGDDPKNSSLRELFLYLPAILEHEDPIYLEPLTLMIKGNQTLTTLTLRGLKLPPEIWKDRFFPALKENATLEKLDLRSCKGLQGVLEAVMDLLQNSNTALRKIYLYQTGLQDKQSQVDEELRINKEYRSALRGEKRLEQTTSGRLVLCGFGFGGKTEICKTMQVIDGDTGPHLLEMGWKKLMQTFPALRRLLFGKDACRELSSRTRGCDMSILENLKPLKSIWDFAGQKEYYALHDYLFPDMNNSCFLFVCSCRDLPDDQSPKGKIKDLQRVREECHYWMQFVASNSKLRIGRDGQGRKLPCVVFVLTKKDTLDPSELGYAEERAKLVVNDLRSVFKDVVVLCETANVVDARSAEDVKKLVTVVRDILENTLKGQEEYAVCQEVREVLGRWSAGNPSKPILKLDEYYKLCEKVQLTKGQPVSDEGWKVVLAYLNDLGEIIFLKGLGFIVTNPRWFGLGVLGSLINAFKGTEVSSGLLRHRRSVWGSLEHDNGYVTRGNMENLLKHSLETMHLEQPLTVDQLIDLMLELEMCYKQDPKNPLSKLFMPALFDDLTDRAAQGQRQLKWNLNERGPFVYLGRRLVCKDKDTMILTPGFFPRWQVHLLNFIREKGWVSNRAFEIGRNLIGFAENCVEVFIEYSGDIDYFVDILVRSTKPFEEALQFIDDHVVQNLRDFCALRQGCQGVDLVEAVIRPVCVRKLHLCIDRKAQSVLISTLKDKFASDKHWKYTWPKRLDSEIDTSSAIELLEGEGSSSSLGTTQPGLPSSSASRSKPSDDLPKLVYPSTEDVGNLTRIVTRLNVRKDTAFMVHLLCDNRYGSHKVKNQPGRLYILHWKDGGFNLPIAKYLVTFAYAAAGVGTTLAGAPCVLPPIDNLVKKCFDVPVMPVDLEKLQRVTDVPATACKEDILKVLTEYMEIDPHALNLKEFLKPEEFNQFKKHFQLNKVVYTEGPHQDQVFWVCDPCYEAEWRILRHVPQ